MAAKSYLKTALAISLFLVVLAASTTAQEKIIYVDDDATGANDGSSWVDAYNYLQDALADANNSAKPNVIASERSERGNLNTITEIRVAQGIYKPDQGAGITPGDRAATFQLINGVTLKGGYAGYGQPDPDARDIELYETILSGDLEGNDIDVNDPYDLLDEPTRSENSYNVVNGSNTDKDTILDGFSIINGNDNRYEIFPYPYPLLYPIGRGAGMCSYSGRPTLANCTFTRNSVNSIGGGMYNDLSSPILTNCTFSFNCAGDGGGIGNFASILKLINCTLRENFASRYGGGFYGYCSTAKVNNCLFERNSSQRYGGGLFSRGGSLTLINCGFTENSSICGAGIAKLTGGTMIMNCTITGNSAFGMGGGIWCCDAKNAILKNCEFSGNSAKLIGGALVFYKYFEDYHVTTTALVNCTFASNSALNGNTLIVYSEELKYSHEIDITNCILWNGGCEIYNLDDSKISITYTDVKGGQTAIYDPCNTFIWGVGNIDVEPFFSSPGYRDANSVWIDGDYHLLPDSPCIDAGDPDYMAEPNETDLDGNPRIINGRVDMGAYEYSPPIQADIRIIPRTINLRSKGQWIAAFIRLPEEYNVADIDPDSILLENEIEPEHFWPIEYLQIAIARFDCEEVRNILSVGETELTITGQLTDGTIFEGRDTVKVIDKGGRKSAK